jgi:cytochrome P450
MMPIFASFVIEVRMRTAIEARSPVWPVRHRGGDAATGRGIARAMGQNALLAFPPQAFEEDVVHRRFFGRRQIILNRPAAIQHILIDNPGNYHRTAATIRMLRPLLGNGLLLSEGEDWRQQRRTVAPALAPRMIPMLTRHIAQVTGDVVPRLAALCDRPVDLLTEMQFLALEIAGRSMFSVAMDRYSEEMRDLIMRYAEHVGRPALLDLLLPLSIPSPRDIARRRVRRRWVDLMERIIAERRALSHGAAPGDLFDLISTTRDPETGMGFSGERLLDQIATLITAGHETTAVALFWALYVLSGAPEIQERLSAEVAGVDLGQEHAADALPKLIYTRAVVHETLRLYPPAFMLARQAREDDIAGGIPVARKSVVFIAPWVLHRHRRLWTRPEVFDPTRFLSGTPPPDRFAYMPFGIGPRVCVGAQFALTEAMLVLASLIQAFRIERGDDDPVEPIAIVTTQPDHPPLFRLQRRVRTQK